jgi:hypothetical protein
MLVTTAARAEDIPVECPPNPTPDPKIERRDVYKDSPFKAGEKMVFEVTWGGIKVGYADLEVRAPRRMADNWHRVFHLSAQTGDWFETIFIAKEEMEAISRPWDFGVVKFYMHQKEGKLWSSPFHQEKWLEFDHTGCVVQELIKRPEKPDNNESHPFLRGGIDALGVLYNLRTRKFEIGKVERAPVYTSEKNWWLEAKPLSMEQITVPAGTFNTVKLQLQTFIGKELQQKGDVFAWISTDDPNVPVVQLQGEIKIGSVYVKLHKFERGG